MQRTISLAVLGFAVASATAMAGVYISPADRAARQQERAGAEQRNERSPEPAPPDSRADAPRGEPRNDRRDDQRHERRHDGNQDVAPRNGYRGSRDYRDSRNRRDDGDLRDYGNHRDYGGHRDHRDHREHRDNRYGRDDHRYRDSRLHWQSARPRDWNDDRRSGWRDERGRAWHYSRDWYDRYRAEHFRYDQGRYLARQRFSLGVYFAPRGYAPRYWQRGQWLPSSYYAERRYHLLEYARFDLYDPPFGARWVRVGSDALLIDYDSGEVLDVVFALFW